MSDPSGPVPPSVYLRRRILAIVSSIVALVLVIWGISAMMSGGDPQATPPRPAPVVDAAGSTSPTASSPASPTSSSTTSATASTSASASGSATPSSSAQKPTPTPKPKPCPDNAIVVAATVGQHSYRVGGKQPMLGMTIINIGKRTCTRNVGRSLRDLVVSSASGARQWSSNDCYFVDPPSDVRALKPGQQLHYDLSWAGRSSSKGCPVKRHTIPPGHYELTAMLGNLPSAPTPFTLTK